MSGGKVQIPLSPPFSKGEDIVPAVLVRQGVGAVSDNLFPGDVLNVGRLFMNMFRHEIEERLVRLPGQERGGS